MKQADDILNALHSKANGSATRGRAVYGEDRLQKDCIRWFDYQHRHYRLLLHHSANEGRLVHSARDGAKRKAMGMRAGFPDLIFMQPNRHFPYLALELKTAKGRLSESQKEYQKAVENAGGCYAVIRSLDEFINTINEYINNI